MAGFCVILQAALMKLEYLYISDEDFYPERFKSFLESSYKFINSDHKPFGALHLKRSLIRDAISPYGICKLDILDQMMYNTIVEEAFNLYGNIDDHIKDCIGRQVHFTLWDHETGAGTIKDFFDYSYKLTDIQKQIGLTNIGYKISTKTGDRKIQTEGFFSINLMNKQ